MAVCIAESVGGPYNREDIRIYFSDPWLYGKGWPLAMDSLGHPTPFASVKTIIMNKMILVISMIPVIRGIYGMGYAKGW